MQISDLTRKSKLPKIDSSDILPLAFAGLSVGVFILAIALFWLAVSFSKLANQKPPTLVQQVNGHAFSVRPADYNYREPEVIRRFVSDWAVMTFTWGKLPGDQRNTMDEGVAIAGNKRVSTAAWEAAFALAPDFRDTFLEQLATEVIPDGVFDGNVSAVLVPQQISPPQAAGDGHWQVDLIATRIVFNDANPAGYTIPFNRRIFVRAVEPARQPLIQNASEYQQVVYRMLEGGIQIEEIRPINTEELSQ
jgi:hypothetical protein